MLSNLDAYKNLLKARKIRLLEIPTNNQSNAMHRCLVCKHTWCPKPNNVKSGYGCPVCGLKKQGVAKSSASKLELEKFLLANNSQVLLQNYRSARSFDVKCSDCCAVFSCESSRFRTFKNFNCRICSPRFPIGRRISVDAENSFIQLCNSLGIVINSYKGTNKYASLTCSKGHNWETFPTVISSGSGCPDCAVTNSFVFRSIRLSGVDFFVQGYEDAALVALVHNLCILPQDIKYGKTVVPRFHYQYGGKLRRYYPDFQVYDNIIVEVKSTFTAGLLNDNREYLQKLKSKARAVFDSGFIFRVMVVDLLKSRRARLPSNWLSMSKKQILKSLEWFDITDSEGNPYRRSKNAYLKNQKR